MSATMIVEAVNVFKDSQFSSTTCVPRMLPDQFSLDGFKESLDDSIVLAIPFAAHGCFESVLAQTFLIIV